MYNKCLYKCLLDLISVFVMVSLDMLLYYMIKYFPVLWKFCLEQLAPVKFISRKISRNKYMPKNTLALYFNQSTVERKRPCCTIKSNL